ncbi:hypothetical protein COLO4_36834 [Corchorus olitorius]|uniref:Uncharacterized protein n=1 Tax=Corchorus olitorius TaxID=93759 RepID=A0A1R3G4Z7_9ROSI|nr:hypothetical protein COLO4_36834 [Corchorus olitorius]
MAQLKGKEIEEDDVLEERTRVAEGTKTNKVEWKREKGRKWGKFRTKPKDRQGQVGNMRTRKSPNPRPTQVNL